MFPVPIKRINLDHIRIIRNIVSIITWRMYTKIYSWTHVELDCLLSTTYAAKTKTISTLEDLFQSINHKVDISLPIEIQLKHVLWLIDLNYRIIWFRLLIICHVLRILLMLKNIYFGFTYISEILLGGINQEIISISNKLYKKMKALTLKMKQELHLFQVLVFHINLNIIKLYINDLLVESMKNIQLN